MKTPLFVALSLVFVSLIAGGLATQEPAPGAVDALMARKLVSSQKVLEGLVTDNFALMGREASQLRLYSQEADWNVLQTRDYQRLSGDFRRAADDLQTASKTKNLDAASVAYIKLTLTCIDCHRHVRAQPTD